MTADLTLLYYSANKIAEPFARAVRTRLLESTGGSLPVVAVIQAPQSVEPLQTRVTLCLGDIGASIYNVYRQVLLAAHLASTPFVACCEDDTVYSPEHFAYRPPLDTFGYDLSRWVITRNLSEDGRRREAIYYWRHRHQMAMCIAPRELLIETLEERFAKYPVEVPHEIAKRTGWGEPGRYEKNLGLTRRAMADFHADMPSVTFNHSLGVMGRRKVNPDDKTCSSLPIWGEADALWSNVHGQ